MQISTPRSSNAFFKVSTSLGYLLPTSDPVNPARAISLTHCSKVFSFPKSGKSSLVHAMGAIPNFTFSLFNMFVSPSLIILLYRRFYSGGAISILSGFISTFHDLFPRFPHTAFFRGRGNSYVPPGFISVRHGFRNYF